MSDPIAGVFFDLGGTLYSYRRLGATLGPLIVEVGRRLGAGDLDARTIGQRYKRAGEEVSHDYATREFYLHRDYFEDTLRRFCELIDGEWSDEVSAWYHADHSERIVNGLELKPGCHETLAELRDRGLYLSVVSNIDDDLFEPLMRRDALAEYFHHYTSSEQTRSCKPHRRFFEACLEKSGLPAAQVLFVGDSPEHDIEGASALGMRTALIVEPGVEPPLQTGRATASPDHVVHSLAEIPSLLD